jgi:hypothetical protein
VLESEWCARDDAIDCDFQKHRVHVRIRAGGAG